MLLASEPLVVVPFTLEELLEVWFAVKLPLQCCIASQTTEQRNQEITYIYRHASKNGLSKNLRNKHLFSKDVSIITQKFILKLKFLFIKKS